VSTMKKITVLTVSLMMLILCANAGADIVAIGEQYYGEGHHWDWGYCQTFPEFDLNVWNNFPVVWGYMGASCIVEGPYGEMVLGFEMGVIHVRKSYNQLLTPASPDGINYTDPHLAIRDFGINPTGPDPNYIYIACGEYNGLFLSQRSGLGTKPSDYTGNNALWEDPCCPIDELEVLSDGKPVYGTGPAEGYAYGGGMVGGPGCGRVEVRHADDLAKKPDEPNNGFTADYGGNAGITALAVTSSDEVCIGYLNTAIDDGWLDVRDWDAMLVSKTSVNFGVPITDLEVLSNDYVVIGLYDGSVYIRDSANVVMDLGTQYNANFTVGAHDRILDIAVTSGDNVVIVTDNNQVFVRRGDNLHQTPAGYLGDGRHIDPWDQYLRIPCVETITTAYPGNPPTNCDQAVKAGYVPVLDGGGGSDFNRDCYVNLSDLRRVGKQWLAPSYGYVDYNEGVNQAGPGSVIDMLDFEEFANDWLKCIDPCDPCCTLTYPW